MFLGAITGFYSPGESTVSDQLVPPCCWQFISNGRSRNSPFSTGDKEDRRLWLFVGFSCLFKILFNTFQMQFCSFRTQYSPSTPMYVSSPPFPQLYQESSQVNCNQSVDARLAGPVVKYKKTGCSKLLTAARQRGEKTSALLICVFRYHRLASMNS